LTLNKFRVYTQNMALTTTLTLEQLKRAVQIRENMETLQAELNAILSGEAQPRRRGRKPGSGAAAAASTPTKKKGKRTMSPEARERIAAAQRRRWAKQKREAKE
jgi:hypothetical protein